MWSTSLRCLYSGDALNVRKRCGIVYIQWTKFFQCYAFIITFIFLCDITVAKNSAPIPYNSGNQGSNSTSTNAIFKISIIPFYNTNSYLKLNLTLNHISGENKDKYNVSIKQQGPSTINKCQGNSVSYALQTKNSSIMIPNKDEHNYLLLSKCIYKIKITPLSNTSNPINIKYEVPVTSTATNIKVYPFYNYDEREIKLNVTWQNPTEPILPLDYTVKMIPLNSSTQYCEANSQHQEKYIRANETSLIFPEKIIPRCSYKIEVIEQPANDNEPPAIIFTVPECVENHCACHYIQPYSPRPVISVSRQSSNTVKVLWNIPKKNRMRNISTIFFCIYLTHSTIDKQICHSRNITNSEIVSEMVETIKISSMTTGAFYTIQAWYKNISFCESDHAVLSFYAVPLWEIHQILLSVIFALVIILLLYIIVKRKFPLWLSKRWLCYRLRGQHRTPYPQIRKIYRPATDGAHSRPYFSVPMEYNNLYIENHIAEEQARGKVDKYEINFTRLHLEKEIGNGAFGRVYRARITTRNSPGYSIVAVKKLAKNTSAEEMEEFLLEIAMHKHVGQHQNIVTFLGCCTLRKPYCMIMEYVPCGDLLRYLQALRKQYEKKNKTFLFTVNKNFNISRSSNHEKQRVSDSSYITPDSVSSTRLPSVTETEYTILGSDITVPTTPEVQENSPILLECILDPRELQNFALQIARGMEYLEHKQIVHRDLAARNVLIDENKTLKISDFGLSRSGIYVNSKQKKVPLRWLSIEAIRDNIYTSKSDVWAYGVVLWEIGTLGAFPYNGIIDNNQIIKYLLDGKRLEKPENCTDELYDIMLQCWSCIADDRPSFADLVKYLQTISNKRRVYIDFSHLNPSYVFPPTEEQIHTNEKTEGNIKTIEIILPNKNY